MAGFLAHAAWLRVKRPQKEANPGRSRSSDLLEPSRTLDIPLPLTLPLMLLFSGSMRGRPAATEANATLAGHASVEAVHSYPSLATVHVEAEAGPSSAAAVSSGPLCVASLWVALVALVTGLLLVRRRAARGPPHPFASALVSGMLVGISVLVILPEALEELPAAGWKVSHVLMLFLSSAAVMFFLDHTVMEHQHVMRGETVPSRSALAVRETPAFAEVMDDQGAAISRGKRLARWAYRASVDLRMWQVRGLGTLPVTAAAPHAPPSHSSLPTPHQRIAATRAPTRSAPSRRARCCA